TSGGKQCCSQQRHGCLWTWRSALPTPDRSAAVCWWGYVRDDQAAPGYRAAPPAPIKSKDRSRSLNHLSQVSRERSKAPLLVRSRAGRRSRTLAKARTDSGAAHRSFRARKEMGATQSKHLSHGGNVARPRSAIRSDRLEKRIDSATGNKRNRRSAV